MIVKGILVWLVIRIIGRLGLMLCSCFSSVILFMLGMWILLMMMFVKFGLVSVSVLGFEVSGLMVKFVSFSVCVVEVCIFLLLLISSICVMW